MADDWLRRFQDFSRTVDLVDDNIFNEIKDLLERSFREAWRICFFRVLTSGHIIRTDSGNTPALSTIWSRDLSDMDIQIARENGEATTLTSYAYLNCKPMWIKARDDSKLIQHTMTSEGLVDQWAIPTALPELPPYNDPGGSESRTLVILPMHYGGRMFGVVSLEFVDAIPISSRAKTSANIFADSLARIIWLHQTNKTQINDTKEALERLSDASRSATNAFKRKTVFLASSADEKEAAVVQTLTSILKKDFGEEFELEYWAEETASGGINDQVRASIAAAEFGICYLSERDPKDPGRYVDNPNVLFEAGMFQMLHQLRDDPGKASSARWIPVRESDTLTTPLPFDIAGDRVLQVPRDSATGEVDTDELGSRLRSAIAELTQSLEIA